MTDKIDIWMPIFIGDYLSDTMHLTTEQHGAYLLLLMAYWKNKGPLPNDDKHLAAICKMDADAWANAQALLRSFFETNGDNRLVSKRADKEIKRWCAKRKIQSEKGKKGASARWNKDKF